MSNKQKNFVDRCGPWVGLLGGVVGIGVSIFTANIAYKAFPLDQREAISNSYKEEIESAEKRGDAKKVARLRLEYEDYQQYWRKQQQLAALVEKNIRGPIAQVKPEEKEAIKAVLASVKLINTASNFNSIPQKTLGDAFLISGEPEQALNIYRQGIFWQPDNPELYYSEARAYATLAQEAENEDLKEEYEQKTLKAFENFNSLNARAKKPIRISVDPVILQTLTKDK